MNARELKSGGALLPHSSARSMRELGEIRRTRRDLHNQAAIVVASLNRTHCGARNGAGASGHEVAQTRAIDPGDPGAPPNFQPTAKFERLRKTGEKSAGGKFAGG